MKKKSKKTPDKAVAQEWKRALKAAHGGKLAWLHTLILKAGYTVGGIDIARVTATDVGKIFGLTPQAIGLWHSKQGCPRSKDGTYDLPTVVAWRAEWQAERLGLGDGDPLAENGPASPNLERFRGEKAREARRKNDEAERLLVTASDVEHQLADIANVFRDEAEAIERLHGKKVGAAIRKMIDRAETHWTELYGHTQEATK